MTLSMRSLGLSIALALSGCTVTITRQPITAPPPRAATPIDAPRPAAHAPVPPEPVTVDPDAASTLERGLSVRAVAFSDADPPKLTAIAVANTARSEARGMTADGGAHHATLGEGQRASLPLSLSPGDCITVVAHGGLGVMEVDAFLLGPSPSGDTDRGPGGKPIILAQDTKNGPIAVIGGQAGCYAYVGASPVEADLVVQSRRGAGPVVVRVFRASATRPAKPEADAPRPSVPPPSSAATVPGPAAPGAAPSGAPPRSSAAPGPPPK